MRVRESLKGDLGCHMMAQYFNYFSIFLMNFLQEDVILKLDNSAQIFNTLSDIPGDVTDADQLLEVYGTMQYSVIMSSHMKLNLKVDSGIY